MIEVLHNKLLEFIFHFLVTYSLCHVVTLQSTVHSMTWRHGIRCCGLRTIVGVKN